jgi:hypothetical protein
VKVRGKAKQYGRTNGFLFETFLAPTVRPQIEIIILGMKGSITGGEIISRGCDHPGDGDLHRVLRAVSTDMEDERLTWVSR